MKLTHKNYFTLENQYLSSSKLKDFRKDPFYFYSKNVKGKIKFKPTTSMKVGSAVDAYLTGSPQRFNKEFKEVSKCNNKVKHDYVELNTKEYATTKRIINAVKKTSIFKSIKNDKYISQKILQVQEPIGIFKGIAGIPDWFKILDDECIIIDLKTTAKISTNAFRYAAHSLGYYFQQAMYQRLIKMLYPHVERFESYILAVENDDTFNRVKLFHLDQEEIGICATEIDELLIKIRGLNNNDFTPTDVSWDDVEEL